MGKNKQINILNPTYCFFNDTIIIKNFDQNLMKIDQKFMEKHLCLLHQIHQNENIRMKNVIDYGNIYSENLLYLIINEADEYIEEKNGNEYLTFVSTDKKREVLENYT